MWLVRPSSEQFSKGFDICYKSQVILTTVEGQTYYQDEELVDLCGRLQDFLNTKPCMKCRKPIVVSEGVHTCAACASMIRKSHGKDFHSSGVRRRGRSIDTL